MSDSAEYRHARDVNALAPKPGHHLATVSFRKGNEAFLLWVIEGPENDTLSFRGMASDFEQTRFFRFRLSGLGIEALGDLPYSPHDHRHEMVLEREGKEIRLTVLFSPMRGPGGTDPDAALMRVECGDEPVVVSITELRRAWMPSLLSAGVGAVIPHLTEGAEASGYLRVHVPAHGVTVEGPVTAEGGLRSSAAL